MVDPIKAPLTFRGREAEERTKRRRERNAARLKSCPAVTEFNSESGTSLVFLIYLFNSTVAAVTTSLIVSQFNKPCGM